MLPDFLSSQALSIPLLFFPVIKNPSIIAVSCIGLSVAVILGSGVFYLVRSSTASESPSIELDGGTTAEGIVLIPESIPDSPVVPVGSQPLVVITSTPSNANATITCPVGQRVNLRRSPSGEVMRTINCGEGVRAIAKFRTGWMAVEYKEAIGFVFSKYVDECRTDRRCGG